MTKNSWFFCREFKTSMNLLASSSSIGSASSGVSWRTERSVKGSLYCPSCCGVSCCLAFPATWSCTVHPLLETKKAKKINKKRLGQKNV